MRSNFKRLLAVIGLAGLLAVPATSAWAEDPVTIPSGTNIVDNANVLGGRKAEVQEAIQKLTGKSSGGRVTQRSNQRPKPPSVGAHRS